MKKKTLIIILIILFALTSVVSAQDLTKEKILNKLKDIATIENDADRLKAYDELVKALGINSSEASKETTVGENETTKKSQQENRIEGGFIYEDVKFDPMGGVEGSYYVSGKMTNDSGKDYDSVFFVLLIYNESGKVIAKMPFQIDPFPNEITKPFNTIINGVNPSAAAKYRIKVENTF